MSARDEAVVSPELSDVAWYDDRGVLVVNASQAERAIADAVKAETARLRAAVASALAETALYAEASHVRVAVVAAMRAEDQS